DRIARPVRIPGSKGLGVQPGIHDEKTAAARPFPFERLARGRATLLVDLVARDHGPRQLATRVLGLELQRPPVRLPIQLEHQRDLARQLLLVSLSRALGIGSQRRGIEAERFHLGLVEPPWRTAAVAVAERKELRIGGLLLGEDAPAKLQRKPAVLAIAVPGFDAMQLALAQPHARPGLARAVPQRAAERDRVREREQGEAGDERARAFHAAAPRRTVRTRLNTSSSSTEVSAITRKNSHFGMISHHQS